MSLKIFFLLFLGILYTKFNYNLQTHILSHSNPKRTFFGFFIIYYINLIYFSQHNHIGPEMSLKVSIAPIGGEENV